MPSHKEQAPNKKAPKPYRVPAPLSPVFTPFTPTFMSDQEWSEYQRQHDPEGYERWKKDQEQARLARLKEQNFGQWAATNTSDQLKKELLSLDSRRIALEREKPELIGRARWPFQGPLGKQYAEVIYYIEVLKAELIKRGEALDTAEGKSTNAAPGNMREAFITSAPEPAVQATPAKDQKPSSSSEKPKHVRRRKKPRSPVPLSIPAPSRRRAQTAARLIEELNTLKPLMHNEQYYSRLAGKYPSYLCFKIARGHEALQTKLENLQDHHRHIRLAQELAAARHGCTLSTIQTDWKKNKPKRYKRGA